MFIPAVSGLSTPTNWATSSGYSQITTPRTDLAVGTWERSDGAPILFLALVAANLLREWSHPLADPELLHPTRCIFVPQLANRSLQFEL